MLGNYPPQNNQLRREKGLTACNYHSSTALNIQGIALTTTRGDHQQERHRFAVVRRQQQRFNSTLVLTSVPVVEEKLDTATRAQVGDGEGKERRRISVDFR